MNWTSSFLVQNNKLATVLHLLLAPVGTVVKPAERRCRDALCSIVGRRHARLVEEQGLTRMFSELLVFGEMPVFLVFKQAAWAHNL